MKLTINFCTTRENGGKGQKNQCTDAFEFNKYQIDTGATLNFKKNNKIYNYGTYAHTLNDIRKLFLENDAI